VKQLVPAGVLASLQREAQGRLELPGEMLHQARRRVRVAAACGAVAYAAFLLFGISPLAETSAFERQMNLTTNLIGLCLCASVLLVALAPPIKDAAVLSMALIAQVLLCGVISVEAPWVVFERTGDVPALTWVVPVIILFPLLVPAKPALALVASLAAAAATPLGMWFLETRHLIDVGAASYWRASVANGVAVVIAMVGSHTIHGAGMQVAAARRVGSYELEQPLGKGGMGEVWRARHAFLARPAAVKLILPEALQGPSERQDAVVERFRREAQATASLRSPHTVDLYDFGVSADGTLYYAMELLEGINLEHFVYTFGPIEARRAVHWLRQICHSLGEAHARGFVHRDIKPGNLFLCRYGRDVDFVKVLDFGLVKPAAVAAETGLTAPGARLGTAAYMAPELVFGIEADARTDVYAVGCVGYWLLTGKRPFEGESDGEVLRQHAQAPPPALSANAAHPVPERLEALLAACLAKDPHQRPASADVLCAALEKCLDGDAWTVPEGQTWWAENQHRL
jgi:serine/threonine-protein kinase